MRKIFWMMAAVVLLTSCGVDQRKYDDQVRMTDSLTAVCKVMQEELDGYRYSPAKLLSAIRGNYAAKEYNALKTNLDLMQKYHPDAAEYGTANGIYQQAVKDQEEARKKAEAEAAKREAERKAKMSKVEKIMEKLGCDEETATMISKGQVRIGMTTEQCRAAWGKPERVNRSVGSYGVHEQWVYGYTYLYFENGKMTSFQD